MNRLFLVLIFIATFPSLSAASLSSIRDCEDDFVSREFPYNFSLVDRRWTSGRTNYPAFESVSLFYSRVRRSGDLLTMDDLLRLLVASKERSLGTANRILSHMKSAGFLYSAANSNDGRARLPVFPEAGKDLYLEFLAANRIDMWQVEAFLNFSAEDWPKWSATSELSEVIFVIKLLEDHPDGLGPSSISSKHALSADVSLGTANRALAGMVRDGFVSSMPSPEDQRKQLYRLTAKSKQLILAMQLKKDEAAKAASVR